MPEETDNISADYLSVCNLLVRMHDEVLGARRLHKARLMTVNINHGQNSARVLRVLRLRSRHASCSGAEKVKKVYN